MEIGSFALRSKKENQKLKPKCSFSWIKSVKLEWWQSYYTDRDRNKYNALEEKLAWLFDSAHLV